jgi:hypothetical protein
VIFQGNPADAILVEGMVNNHDQIYGRYPLKAALEGGFASKKTFGSQSQRAPRISASPRSTASQLIKCAVAIISIRSFNSFAGSVQGSSQQYPGGRGLSVSKSPASFKSYVWYGLLLSRRTFWLETI